MSFEITPMRNRVLPIALGAAVAVVSLGAIAIPAANAQPMVVVRPAGHHHHHLVCHSCDVVIDVELPSHIENLMDEEFEKAASGSKFTVDRHNIDIVGTCSDCQETAQV